MKDNKKIILEPGGWNKMDNRVRNYKQNRLKDNENTEFPEWERTRKIEAATKGSDKYEKEDYVIAKAQNEQDKLDIMRKRIEDYENLETRKLILEAIQVQTQDEVEELQMINIQMHVVNWKGDNAEYRKMENQAAQLERTMKAEEKEHATCSEAIQWILGTVDRNIQREIQVVIAKLNNDTPNKRLKAAIAAVKAKMKGDIDLVRSDIADATLRVQPVTTYMGVKTLVEDLTVKKRQMDDLCEAYGGINPIAEGQYYQILLRCVQSPALSLIQMVLQNNNSDRAEWEKITSKVESIIEQQCGFEKHSKVTQIKDTRAMTDIQTMKVEMNENNKRERKEKQRGGQCYQWLQKGLCSYGNKCRFDHSLISAPGTPQSTPNPYSETSKSPRSRSPSPYSHKSNRKGTPV